MVNVGSIDRALRATAGVALIGFGYLDTSPWRWLGAVGGVLLATAAFRFCPAYRLLRIRTSLPQAEP